MLLNEESTPGFLQHVNALLQLIIECVADQEPRGSQDPWLCSVVMAPKVLSPKTNHREAWIKMPRGLPAPQFEIRELWVKWMENGVVKQAWNMLQDVGSPEPRHTHTWPTIPEWNQRMGGFNFQIEATIVNKTSATLNLKFRTQTCPRGTSGLPPMPKPPCGDLVDSGAAAKVGPYGTVLLPISQLRMWGKNIDQHCEIVDANDQTIYNCLVRYRDNAEYRADDWYIPIDSAGAAGIPSTSFWQRLSGAQPGQGGVQEKIGPQPKVGLASLFEAALKSMSQNRQAINRMDGYNGNHGDNMTQNLQVITDALRSRQSQPPAEALRYASQMLQSNGVGGSSRYYAQGLDDAAAMIRDKPQMGDADITNLVLSMLNAVPTQSDPGRSQVSDNVLAQMMGLAGQQPTPPTKDSGAASQLLSMAIPAALAFMQAKQAGGDTKSAAVQSLMSSLVGGQVNPLQASTPRAAAGSLIAKSILQAMLG